MKIPPQRKIPKPNQLDQLVWFVVLSFAIILSFDLLAAWKNDPQNRFGPLAFIFWLILAFFFKSKSKANSEMFAFQPASPIAVGLSASLLLLGSLSSLNVLQHFGFATALACALSASIWHRFILVTLAIFWMPLFSWISLQIHLPEPNFIRPFPALVALVLLVLHHKLYHVKA